jgi:hypothetical protein
MGLSGGEQAGLNRNDATSATRSPRECNAEYRKGPAYRSGRREEREGNAMASRGGAECAGTYECGEDEPQRRDDATGTQRFLTANVFIPILREGAKSAKECDGLTR